MKQKSGGPTLDGSATKPSAQFSNYSLSRVLFYVKYVKSRLIYTGWSTSEKRGFCGNVLSKQVNTPLFLHGVTSSTGRKKMFFFQLTKSIYLLAISMYLSYSNVTIGEQGGG